MDLEFWILLRLLIATVLSGLIGYERESTGKQAGLRTHMLVAVGAALFVSFTQLFAIDATAFAPPGPVGNLRVQIEPLATVEEAVARALAVTPPEGQVVVAGSLYLVGAARSALT